MRIWRAARTIAALALVGVVVLLWQTLLLLGLGVILLFLIIMSIVTVNPDRAVTRPWR